MSEHAFNEEYLDIDTSKPLQPEQLPRVGERWLLDRARAAKKAGLKPAAAGPLVIEVFGATTVWVHTPDGWRGRLTIRQLLQFWRRA